MGSVLAAGMSLSPYVPAVNLELSSLQVGNNSKRLVLVKYLLWVYSGIIDG